ncbi:flagellar biosynthesis anti-sigma factor FlgM [Catenovulum sp. 2E275]|uniref:flagellar biosynthesis anti-sigma factor FlgM n=1 Tax=Catenovulum sp. 2E275 TaxID=2980497 RepID=UPI0021D18356|nr:flagellar biosynthesis anti-sigma factor FlgM [Catenovulum sp. 2E275]MCU4676441.1 flagellar biosynthesis anti-sigma factor FlgM [Catenovulum sp. 2E275]
MNLNNLNNNQLGKTAVDAQKTQQNQQANNQQANQVAQQAASTSAPRQDSVSLTQTAQNLNNLTKKAANSTGFDQEKVDRLKKAVASGEYKVNAEKLANNIIASEGKLFGL